MVKSNTELSAGIGGALIFLMVILTIANDVLGSWWSLPIWVIGVPGWMAAAALISRVSVTQRWQTGFIAVCGLMLMIFALFHGIQPAVSSAISNNAGLISMIAAVGFLRLIATPQARDETLPVGARAYFKTLLGVSLFGTVINISAPVIFADRLFAAGALSRLASQSITRIFSGCSAWSPFFGGMAAVVTYVPTLSLAFVMLCCLPFAFAGFVLVFAEARMRFKMEVAEFRGYPVQFSSLWIPVVLASLVLMLSQVLPEWSVLTRISISALGLTVTVLSLRMGCRKTLRILQLQVTETMPGMVNELLLFLVAGVLAAGLASVIGGGLISIATIEFHWHEAVLLVGAMILLSVVGIHPVVTISGATPLLLALGPDPNLLAVAYLLAWSLGTCGSPLSGTHLVFQGRYGVPGWKGALWNLPYVAVMFLVAIPLLFAVDQLISL